MLNSLWAGMILIGIIFGAWNGKMPELTNAALDSSKDAVSLCITMLGVMAFWCGIMEIARAILKDAPIVVFDEATSYSDIENEHKIQLALQNLLRGKTTIMIAHRLHTIRNADKIFVFQDGKVVEQGTHDELIASGSTYSHMWDTYTRETIGEE